MKKIVLVLIGFLFITGCSYQHFDYYKTPNEKVLKLRLATTTKEKANGLAGMEELESIDGMLFIFEKPTQVVFWMKNMLFPVDILYLDSNFQVVEIFPNQAPCEIYKDCPKLKADMDNISYVLEIAAGKAEEFHLKINSYLQKND